MTHLLLISPALHKLITAFSWMLIHSLWQGLLLAVVGAVLLTLTRKSGAAQRYNLALILFLTFIGTCAYTFFVEWNSATAGAALPSAAGGIGINVSLLWSGVNELKQFVKSFSDYFSANAPLVVSVWFIFFLFKSVKIISCLVYNHRVKTIQIYEAGPFWAETLAKFTEKLQINKTVKLLQSGYVKIPVVIGHLKPVIIIPLGLMGGLPAEQVEAILLHELAHIGRNDYFVNFLQNMAEAVFFFNPGLLWISSLLREERENCCDDIALAQTQNKKGFVQALISFKEHELYGNAYATAFPGKKNYLMRRVSRILGKENKTFGIGEKIFFTAGIVLLVFAASALAFGQIKREVHDVAISVKYKTAHDSVPTDSILANKDAVKAKDFLKHKSVRHSMKMRDSIAGTALQKARPAYAAIYNPVTPITAVAVAKPVDVSTGQAKELEAGDSRVSYPLTEREQGERDKEQAKKDQAEALKDQAQARVDQAQAVKDRAAAILDQEQAAKDQIQALHNQEQARLNQLQVKKNLEQDARNEVQEKRNEEQARVNEIQARRNQELDARNREQAASNDMQAKKNQEQASKGNVSVQ